MPDYGARLWPVRYRPREDELLSSWLTRLAHGMGLKVQTLCNLEFGSSRQVWNRDIDRLAPQWLLERLCQRTGVPMEAIAQTTLRTYEGVLFRTYRTSSVLPWVLTLKMYHRRWTGNGLQCCPACLAEDDVCYYRRSWRIALFAVCPKHGCLLLDRCPICQAGIVFVRTELGQPLLTELPGLYGCHTCGFDLRSASTRLPLCLNERASTWLMNLCREIGQGSIREDGPGLELIETLHILCSLMTRQRRTLRLYPYLCEMLGGSVPTTDVRKASLETRSVAERSQILQMAAWLMEDLPSRLKQALNDRALRYNHLTRDFRHLPNKYRQIVSVLPHRATRAA